MSGCPTLDAVSSRQGWESTNLNGPFRFPSHQSYFRIAHHSPGIQTQWFALCTLVAIKRLKVGVWADHWRTLRIQDLSQMSIGYHPAEVCPSQMSYESKYRRSLVHCRHAGVHQLPLRRTVARFRPRSIWRDNQLDQCAQLTKKRIRNGITDAVKRDDAFSMSANQTGRSYE